MTDLSPAAQATWCAYEQVLEAECVLTKTDVKALAAALRAAADQLQERKPRASIGIDWSSSELYAIAAELEAL